MASKYWLKLFHETIYDPKVMMRSPLTELNTRDKILPVTGSAGFCLNMANIAQLYILRQAVRLTKPRYL